MSKQQVSALIAEAAKPHVHGRWARFAREHAVSRDQVQHWRRKLGLPMRRES
jgi:hypothetical protein